MDTFDRQILDVASRPGHLACVGEWYASGKTLSISERGEHLMLDMGVGTPTLFVVATCGIGEEVWPMQWEACREDPPAGAQPDTLYILELATPTSQWLLVKRPEGEGCVEFARVPPCTSTTEAQPSGMGTGPPPRTRSRSAAGGNSTVSRSWGESGDGGGTGKGYGGGCDGGPGGGAIVVAASASAGAGGSAGGVPFKPGDWYCTKCGAHNFSKRLSCHQCAAALFNGESTSDASAREAMVAQIKRGQRESKDFKERWYAFCDRFGRGFYDPVRHVARLLQDFLDAEERLNRAGSHRRGPGGGPGYGSRSRSRSPASCGRHQRQPSSSRGTRSCSEGRRRPADRRLRRRHRRRRHTPTGRERRRRHARKARGASPAVAADAPLTPFPPPVPPPSDLLAAAARQAAEAALSEAVRELDRVRGAAAYLAGRLHEDKQGQRMTVERAGEQARSEAEERVSVRLAEAEAKLVEEKTARLREAEERLDKAIASRLHDAETRLRREVEVKVEEARRLAEENACVKLEDAERRAHAEAAATVEAAEARLADARQRLALLLRGEGAALLPFRGDGATLPPFGGNASEGGGAVSSSSYSSSGSDAEGPCGRAPAVSQPQTMS